MEYSNEILTADPACLQALLQAASRPRLWDEEDLAPILLDQLQQPLPAFPGSPSILEILKSGSVSQLTALKDWTKENLKDSNSPLPAAINMILYYSAICAARFHHQVHISTLADLQLSGGIEWCLSHPWLPEEITRILNSAHRGIKTD